MNPKRMGFGALRVVNDDTVSPKSGFPLHHHEEMEIVTIMLSGTLTHEDSMGNKKELKAGEVQVMTAGTGVNHSEWNHDAQEAVRLFQIWIYPRTYFQEKGRGEENSKHEGGARSLHDAEKMKVSAGVYPNKRRLTPRYDQRPFDEKDRKNKFQVLVSGDKKEGALFIHQDVVFSRAFIAKGESAAYQIANTAHGLFLLVIRGKVKLGADELHERDTMEIKGEPHVEVRALEDSDALLIEVPIG